MMSADNTNLNFGEDDGHVSHRGEKAKQKEEEPGERGLPGAGKVVHGLSGWSCASLARCKKYFPPRVTSSSDKLHFMSREGRMGCVEVNSSTYSIPSTTAVESWVKATSKGFIFHFKAFGLLCASHVDGRTLPQSIRQQYCLDGDLSYKYSMLPTEAAEAVWSRFNDSLSPAVDSGKMGAVMFQFHLDFGPSKDNKNFVEMCAQKLRKDVHMAVEFRDRSWLFPSEDSESKVCLQSFNYVGDFDETNATAANTCGWLKSLQLHRPLGGVALVACEDLFEEVFSSSRVPNNCDASRPSLPTILTSFSSPSLAYIRIHRRKGNNRLLTQEEMCRWVSAIKELMAGSKSTLQGPCYILWGTDHEDQPIINMRQMQAELPESIRSSRSFCGSSEKKAMMSMFLSASKQATQKSSNAKLNNNNNDNNNDNIFNSNKKRPVECPRKNPSPQKKQVHHGSKGKIEQYFIKA